MPVSEEDPSGHARCRARRTPRSHGSSDLPGACQRGGSGEVILGVVEVGPRANVGSRSVDALHRAPRCQSGIDACDLLTISLEQRRGIGRERKQHGRPAPAHLGVKFVQHLDGTVETVSNLLQARPPVLLGVLSARSGFPPEGNPRGPASVVDAGSGWRARAAAIGATVSGCRPARRGGVSSAIARLFGQIAVCCRGALLPHPARHPGWSGGQNLRGAVGSHRARPR